VLREPIPVQAGAEPQEAVPSTLDAGTLPVEALALLAVREARRPRAIYQAHKWFARRYGSAFRALLVASATPAGSDFWSAFYQGVDLSQVRLLDPFLGGGTSLVETIKMGGEITGVDVDPVACAISRFEASAAGLPDLAPSLKSLHADVGERLLHHYRTEVGGVEKTVLHYFWVQTVRCGGCAAVSDAHPNHRLALTDTEQWVFCPRCDGVARIPVAETEYHCGLCGHGFLVGVGPAKHGKMTCGTCGHQERLIDIARRDGRPQWRLFALEVLDDEERRPVPMAKRSFLPATEADRGRYQRAQAALQIRLTTAPGWVPKGPIHRDDRIDNRLTAYGYEAYPDLFNSRQLLHLSMLAEGIAGLADEVRPAMALAFSDHLTTNCMMTSYAQGWRRLVPLFAVRAFRHVSRPVELNPWLHGTGRGTFPNAVRQVERAAQDLRTPRELETAGGFRPTSYRNGSAHVVNADSRDLSFVKTESVSLVLTDPPYYDNIAYSELAAFYLPWLKLVDKTVGASGERAPLRAADRGRTAATTFSLELGTAFQEIERTLTADGRAVFTYKHSTAAGWWALGKALLSTRLRVLQAFPILGDGSVTLHMRDNTITWDAVLVLAKGRRERPGELCRCNVQAAERAYTAWKSRLAATVPVFGEADMLNFRRACLVASALGSSGGHCLDEPIDLWNALSAA
jgi:putative DNA methylase